jgi:tetratricopeptide (TPR) repeat protein
MTAELEYIDQYFSGGLSAAEKQGFQDRLQNDEAFAGEVSFYLSSLAVAREAGHQEKKQRLIGLYENKDVRAEGKVTGMRWLRPAMAVAALLILGFLTWTMFMKPPSPVRLADRYIREQFGQLGVEMGNTANPLQEAKKLYNEGKFPEAESVLENILKGKPGDAEAIKLAGIVSLRMENYDKALGYFRWLAEQQGLYANPGEFYRAVTLMKRNLPGDQQKARVLLQEVVDKGLSGKEEAERWLKRLQEYFQ